MMNPLVQNYCDLTCARLDALRLAAKGELQTLNGAMHEAMIELIDEDLTITAWGREVLARAEAIEDGSFEHVFNPTREDVVPRQAAKLLAAATGLRWIQSAEAKLLIAVYRCPGTTLRQLAHGWGHDCVNRLEKAGLLKIDRRLGGPVVLSGLGRDAIGRAGLVK